MSKVTLEEATKAIQSAVREGLVESNLIEVVDNITIICNKARDLNEILQLQKAAYDSWVSGDYGESQKSYLRLARMDPERQNLYLRMAYSNSM